MCMKLLYYNEHFKYRHYRGNKRLRTRMTENIIGIIILFFDKKSNMFILLGELKRHIQEMKNKIFFVLKNIIEIS
jgi:hypothetical protein